MITQVELDGLEDFAKKFWHHVGDQKIFAFHGHMGSGKTTTISALCKALGVKDVIGSPTFSIINEYAYEKDGATKQLFHIDLYRLKNAEEVIDAGVEDCIYSGEICMVEWPEKAPQLFDREAVHLFIQPINEQKRQIKILTAAEFDAYRLTEQL